MLGIVANGIRLSRRGRYGYGYYGGYYERAAERGGEAPAGGGAETPAGGGTPAERA